MFCVNIMSNKDLVTVSIINQMIDIIHALSVTGEVNLFSELIVRIFNSKQVELVVLSKLGKLA